MNLILSNLFDAYGIPIGIDWKVCFLVIILGFASIYVQFSNDDDHSGLESITLILSHIICIAYFGLYIGMYMLNPYEYIPSNGTEVQKAMLKKCTTDKSVSRENIEDIMFDCKKHDLEMELKSITK